MTSEFAYKLGQSLSARRAWIEMLRGEQRVYRYSVALRKESVDRNRIGPPVVQVGGVALRKESVDRNAVQAGGDKPQPLSLSARRAWIEIFEGQKEQRLCPCRSPQGERG